jgi:hypothetical protein
LSPLPAGFYLLRLSTRSGRVYSGKVIVEWGGCDTGIVILAGRDRFS